MIEKMITYQSEAVKTLWDDRSDITEEIIHNLSILVLAKWDAKTLMLEIENLINSLSEINNELEKIGEL